MAQADQLYAVHKDVVTMAATGAAVALLSTSTYFMTYEYKDFERVRREDDGTSKLEAIYGRRRRIAKITLAISAFFYLCAIALICVSICLYRDEREEQATDIPGQISQLRTLAAQPSWNEVSVLASLSSGLTVAGAIQCALTFDKAEEFGWIGIILYAGGWLGNSFAASMNNKGLDSIRLSRLAWTLPGAAAIVAGTVLYPWQVDNGYISGPSWSISALGYAAFVIGTSYVTDPPQLA